MPDLNNPQALNRYAYTLNNPMRYTDPTGNISSACSACGGGYDDYSRPDLIEPTHIPNSNYINLSYSANTYNRSSSQDSDLGTRRIFGDNFDGSNLAFVDADADGLYQPSSSTLFSNDDPTNFEISRYDPSVQLPTTFKDGDGLPGPVINKLRPFGIAPALQRMRLFNGIPPLPRLFRNPDAFAIGGNKAYFAPNAYNPNTASGLARIGHEAFHLQQQFELGTPNFLIQYGSGYLGYRLDGFSDEQAYRLNPLEDGAFSLERQITEHFLRQGLPLR